MSDVLDGLIAAVDRVRSDRDLREVRLSNQEVSYEFRRIAEALRSHLRVVPVFGAPDVPRGELHVSATTDGSRVVLRRVTTWEVSQS